MKLAYADLPYPGCAHLYKNHPDAESITLKKGLTGAKPIKVCEWAFEMMGADPKDSLDDLYPGTGIVQQSWIDWCHLVLTTELTKGVGKGGVI